MDWVAFREGAGWTEITKTIKARQLLILENLLDPSVPVGEVAALRAEYATCNWLLILPDNIMEQEREDEKMARSDYT